MKNIMVLIIVAIMMLTIGCGGGGGSATPSVNTAPVANAGISQNIPNDTLVTLDGSASSDANGDTLAYSWTFASKPTGSSAALSNASIAKPTFTPDVAGAYVLNLVVNDGMISSNAATVTITATVTSAILKLSSQGTLPSGKVVTGFGVSIELPAGVTVKTTTGGAVDSTVVVPSGLLAGNSSMAPVVNYTAATGTSLARLDFTIASNEAAGVGVGEYAAITLILNGVSPTAADFTITHFTPVDLSYDNLTTLTANIILSVQ